MASPSTRLRPSVSPKKLPPTEIDRASRRGDSSRRLSCRSRVLPSLLRSLVPSILLQRRRQPLLSCFHLVLFEVAKLNGERANQTRRRNSWERVEQGEKGGRVRKNRERDGSFEGWPHRGSQDLKKLAGNDGAVAVDERSSMARGGRVSWQREGWWRAREGVVGWHPSWLFFFPPIRTRTNRTYDRRGPRKAQLGLRTRAENAAAARARAVLLREVFNE